MHLSRSKASDKADVLKAVRKRVEAKKRKMNEARSEEATQSDHQQECILSGGVYLLHRLKDKCLPFLQCYNQIIA